MQGALLQIASQPKDLMGRCSPKTSCQVDCLCQLSRSESPFIIGPAQFVSLIHNLVFVQEKSCEECWMLKCFFLRILPISGSALFYAFSPPEISPFDVSPVPRCLLERSHCLSCPPLSISLSFFTPSPSHPHLDQTVSSLVMPNGLQHDDRRGLVLFRKSQIMQSVNHQRGSCCMATELFELSDLPPRSVSSLGESGAVGRRGEKKRVDPKCKEWEGKKEKF